MRIALSLEAFDPSRGGLEQWTWQFARALAEGGHEVHVVAFEFAEHAMGRLLSHHRVPGARSRRRRAAALEAKLRGLDADITHDMGAGWFADLFHPHGGSTVACHEHNLLRIPRWRRIRFWREKRYREQRAIERRQHATPAPILCVSEMVRRHFIELHGLASARLPVVHNGVNTVQFAPDAARRAEARARFGLKDETLYLLVAHNLKLKNARVFLEALARLGDAPVRGMIVGSSRSEPFVELAQRLGLGERVQFLGQTTDVTSCYAAADVCVHPTWYDPCSLVSLEALAMGLPLITTAFNGVAELLEPGREGALLRDPADASELAATMQSYFKRRTRRTQGDAARKLAERHGFDAQVEAILALYREILAGKTRRRS